jgi:cytochrome c-type biogenesis protein CcmE
MLSDDEVLGSPTRAGLRFWIGLVVILLATGYIVTSSMANTTHYRDVHEVAGTTELLGEQMRLRGTVVDGSHRLREGTLDQHLFVLASEQSTMTVTFTGALPDQFEDGASVIATGELLDGTTFAADSLTAQCPSRYENEAPTARDEP